MAMILRKTYMHKVQLTLVNPIPYHIGRLTDLVSVNEYIDEKIIRVHGIPIVHYRGEIE